MAMSFSILQPSNVRSDPYLAEVNFGRDVRVMSGQGPRA